MKSNYLIPLILHSIVIMTIQVLLLINFVIPVGGKFSLTIYLYPLIIMILPLNLPKVGQLLTAFLLGLLIDIFYQSLGVHTSALLFATFLRPFFLRIFEPRGGYRIDQVPTSKNFGMSWFLSYCSLFLFIHLLMYFIADAFSMVYLLKILANTLLSFIASFIVINLYQLIIRI